MYYGAVGRDRSDPDVDSATVNEHPGVRHDDARDVLPRACERSGYPDSI
jgi:hypothetical protein